MNRGDDPVVARWDGLRSPSPDGNLNKQVSILIRDGFWKHLRERHVGRSDEVRLWRDWLGAADAHAIMQFQWAMTTPDVRRNVLSRATKQMRPDVEESYALPMLVTYRGASALAKVASADRTYLAVLRNGAVFILREKHNKFIPHTCYFDGFSYRGNCIEPRYRHVAMRQVLLYCRGDLSSPPAQGGVFPTHDGEYRGEVVYLTEQSWGFGNPALAHDLSRFLSFPRQTTPKPVVSLFPRPRYRSQERGP